MNKKSEVMNIEKIKSILPHRYPFLLVDRILHIEPGNYIEAIKNVTANEEFFQGHFPNKAILPGVIIIEIFAQVAGILSYSAHEEEINENMLFYLVGANNVRFRKPVVPGDQLLVKATFLVEKRNIWKYKVSGYCDGQLVASAELTSVYTEA